MHQSASTTPTITPRGRLYHGWLCTRPFWVFVPVIVVLVAWAASAAGPGFAVLLLLAGLFAWTLLEWGLHRLAHVRPRVEWLRRFVDNAHLRHHREPHNLAGSIILLRASIPLALLLYALAWACFRDPPVAAGFHAGLLAGYLWYELVHLGTHTTWRLPGLRYLRRYHQLHHHQNWNRSFGVTSPLWDWVFGTLPRAKA